MCSARMISQWRVEIGSVRGIIPTEGRRPREVYHPNSKNPSDAYAPYVSLLSLRGSDLFVSESFTLLQCPRNVACLNSNAFAKQRGRKLVAFPFRRQQILIALLAVRRCEHGQQTVNEDEERLLPPPVMQKVPRSDKRNWKGAEICNAFAEPDGVLPKFPPTTLNVLEYILP